MPLDLDQLKSDTETVNDEASSALGAINNFLNGKVAGVNFTTGQKTALRDQFDTSMRAAKVAVDAVITELDAN